MVARLLGGRFGALAEDRLAGLRVIARIGRPVAPSNFGAGSGKVGVGAGVGAASITVDPTIVVCLTAVHGSRGDPDPLGNQRQHLQGGDAAFEGHRQVGWRRDPVQVPA